MATGAGTTAASPSDDNNNPDDFGRVYRAVAAGESAEEVRRVIEACAQGSAERRAAAANTAGGPNQRQTPLQAAHRQHRGDLVGALLEAGAECANLFGNYSTNPLALCISYGQPESLRALLRSGRHDANEPIADASRQGREILYEYTPAHLCIIPARLTPEREGEPRAQLACLEALVQEGGDVNARAWDNETPLHWLDPTREDHDAALDELVRLGADVNATDMSGRSPIFNYADRSPTPPLERLLAHGASVDVVDDSGETPLILACHNGSRGVVLELLRRSSPQTRRAVEQDLGRSAVDAFVGTMWQRASRGPWHAQVITELLASGAPILPHNVPRVLPLVVSHAALRQTKLDAWQSGPWPWRAHDAMVGLALEAREAREVEEEVEAAQRRVEALEEELRELESESGSGSGSGSESEGAEGEGMGEAGSEEGAR